MVKAKKMYLTGCLLMSLQYVFSGESLAAIQSVDVMNLNMRQEQQRLDHSICVENAKHRKWLDLQLQIDALRSQAVTPENRARNAQQLANLFKQQQDVMSRNSWPGC